MRLNNLLHLIAHVALQVRQDATCTLDIHPCAAMPLRTISSCRSSSQIKQYHGSLSHMSLVGRPSGWQSLIGGALVWLAIIDRRGTRHRGTREGGNRREALLHQWNEMVRLPPCLDADIEGARPHDDDRTATSRAINHST